MTTTTVQSTTEIPVWDYCPSWCQNSEHPVHDAADGSTYRLGDEWHSPHYRPTGGPKGVVVALDRENCHLGTRAASNSATTRVPIAMTNQTVALEVDDDGLATLDIDPSSARSLARALVRAADLAEGVTA